MTNEVEIYRQIAERERNSRKAAEALLEAKSLEIYERNRELANTLKNIETLNSALSSMMHAAPDCIITCCQNYKITSMNIKTEHMFGIQEADYIGQSIERLLPIQEQLKTADNASEIYLDNIDVTPPHGRSFPSQIRGSKGMGNPDDMNSYIVLFVHDITDYRKSELEKAHLLDQINEVRRLEALGALTSGIAHEINTPLQYISDNIQFFLGALKKLHNSLLHYENLRQNAREIKDLSELCQVISDHNKEINLRTLLWNIYEAVNESNDGIRQVKDIIKAMREFVHDAPDNQKPPCCVKDILENALRLCRNQAKNLATISLEIEADLPHIPCDPGSIQQVILNIVINALDALQEKPQPDPRIHIAAIRQDDYINIEISDTGPGIPHKIQDKIFDPFFTSKAVGKGTGQGLALAKDIIIKRHMGRLRLGNREGFSTTFVISLPLNPEALAEKAERQAHHNHLKGSSHAA